MNMLIAEHRNWSMSCIRGNNTKSRPGSLSFFHGMGYGFWLKNAGALSDPDFILSLYKTAIFVYGCFWYCQIGCKYTYNPKLRVCFRQKILDANCRCDEHNSEQLGKLGFNQFNIWKFDIKDREFLNKKIKALFRGI